MNILYLCTHNRCRSILFEAITRQKAKGIITAMSAGSQPSGIVHPLSLQYLAETGYSTDNLSSQSWDSLMDEQGKPFIPDVVITVCDSAAAESCPLWLGPTPTLHWGLSDPSKLEGNDADKRDAFLTVIAQIEKRVSQLIAIANLPTDKQVNALSQLISAYAKTGGSGNDW